MALDAMGARERMWEKLPEAGADTGVEIGAGIGIDVGPGADEGAMGAGVAACVKFPGGLARAGVSLSLARA